MSTTTMVRLRDLGNWAGGNTPSKANAAYWTEGTVPWVSPKDMKVDEIASSEDLITELAVTDRRVSMVPAGSVLFVTRSGILAHTFPVAITKVPVTINQDLKALTPKDGISPKYVAHAIRGASQRILRECSKNGTTVASIETNRLLDFEIPLVGIGEQIEIVAELEKQFSRLDEAVANLHRVKANLKRYKASVLKDAVEGRLVPTEAELARREGRSFETGQQLVDMVRDVRKRSGKGRRRELLEPETRGLPESASGWAWTTCDAAIDSIDAGASFKCLEQPPHGEEIGVLKVSAVSWGAYDEDESKTCIDVKRIEQKYVVKPGDFLFSRANTIELVGACVIVGAVRKKLMLSDKTLRFKLNAIVLQDWLLVCLRTKFGRSEIEALSTGNQESMRNIGQERIRQIRMPLPPVAEQQRIVAEVDRRLTLARGLESEVDVNLNRAKALRQSVLKRCFSH